ncbi:hypothetical protein VNO78_24542 [Psophocarpus tetragonolobus]|uniref:Uncharacterized protein n=1 Tax=Psophocarpus tetragonolobus TaxID=3891 RepID=A0AAN9S574_PSOTE
MPISNQIPSQKASLSTQTPSSSPKQTSLFPFVFYIRSHTSSSFHTCCCPHLPFPPPLQPSIFLFTIARSTVPIPTITSGVGNIDKEREEKEHGDVGLLLFPVPVPVPRLLKHMATSLSFSICPASTASGFRLRASTMAMATTVTAPSTKVAPAVIVGGGRVGRALKDMGSGQDLLVCRGESVPLNFDGPIFVCTRNDDLESVLQSTPPSRWADLVFFQNGMMEPWLESKGLEDANQVLAYFAVSKIGETPVDGLTDTNPEGLTAAYGKWASVVAARLNAAGLSCRVLDKEAFQKQMFEKLIWICSVMLVGARHGGVSVGAVEKDFRSELSRLITELASATASEKGITFEEAMEERLCAYSRAVAHFPTAVKEFKWRNGWFHSLSEKASAQGKPDPCPLHSQWLKELRIV